ncbi:type VI secretion system tube protein Hcp [Simiduia sp. 21SJ11W-1]|uniref:type VI secretion system tube protein Hcp n=1 Tax=Simiduia sp. 21SJ11W-1 TaxID=2909669 RepID=UPI00209D9BC1|nr:type VI secretion system tube protein Hcp [Simiduia sp. 21SJ11W-1]UTA48953.1 type VI secretion system tube protein Hcp [Simiduia sp. 21SJ11W-1]
MKFIIPLLFILLPQFCDAAAYIKFDGIDGEAKAVAEANQGFDRLAATRPTLNAAPGQESRLGNGYFLREDGQLLEVKQGRARWIGSPSRDAASGLATGKRQHKPVSIAKPIDKATPKLIEKSSCVGGKVTTGEHKGKKCEHRGHVTVLK